MSTASDLAQAVLSWFHRQKRGGRLGPASAFARHVEPQVLACWLAGLRKEKAPKELAEDAVAEARRQALDLARTVNEGSESLSYNRSAVEVFGPERAALIGQDQDDRARQGARSLVAEAMGEVLEWRNGKRPCPTCKKLHLKRRKPGKMFAVVNGEPVYNPPLHPSCDCTCIRVKARA